MVIKAIVRLQEVGDDRRAFVARGGRPHGTGSVRLYEVTGASWGGSFGGSIQSVLTRFGVIGAHRCNQRTVESCKVDIGKVPASLRRLECPTCHGTEQIPAPAGSRLDRWPCPECTVYPYPLAGQAGDCRNSKIFSLEGK